MADKMLIDASHEEETRVVVVRGSRIEEFDFESQHKKQIKGNIYLAKVTRVEPSLQAAFVDYGGNRHGFLAFAEIHPDYYQIPYADRQALQREEAENQRREDREDADDAVETTVDLGSQDQPDVGIVAAAEDAVVDAPEAVEEDTKPKAKPRRTRKPRGKAAEAAADAEAAGEDAAPAEAVETAASEEAGEDDDSHPGEMAAMVDTDSISEDAGDSRRGRDDEDEDDDHHEKEEIESVGAEDAMEEVPDRVVRKQRKQYRIQEVIKRRQILLVQVAKEERGNKGAALTTYLSLAGRYSVLMPNTARGGGISRKITTPQDRKRLKEVAKSLDVPLGMGVILRTAGANRTKVEVKRDFEYLMRLWENVRTLTLSSMAPCLVYEEGSLIKRSIRDLYNKDISEIVVSGEEGYREAKDFMKMLMPSHAKVVQPYRDIHPIFSRSGIEAQLDRMLQPQVTLKSGGYIIINQTEALVAIDVNSGRSTREHSIEDTALQTNLEAADEVARQLRLRDLAGLIVIDFIDMEEKRNNRSVEKRLKDCLKNDRARIQVGRISHFGLLEMSRQRIRASVLESTTQVCPHCAGTGLVRSQSSVALHVLRGIEEYLLRNTTHNITVRSTPETALYLLNHKRGSIVDYENRFGVEILVDSDPTVGALHFAIDRGEAVENPVKIETLLQFVPEPDDEDDDIIIEIDEEEEEDEIIADKPVVEKAAAASEQTVSDDQNGRKRKRRRRRRNKGGGQNGETQQAGSDTDDGVDSDEDGDDADETDETTAVAGGEDGLDDDSKRKRRRRGKRGGRRNRNGEEGELNADGSDAEDTSSDAGGETTTAPADATETQAQAIETVAEDAASEQHPAAAAVEASEVVAAAPVAPEAKPVKPRRTRKAKAAVEPVEAPVTEAAPVADAEIEAVTEVAADLDETPAAAPTPVETPAPAPTPAAEPVAEAEPAKGRANRGSSVTASEPVITSAQPEGDGSEPTKPKKGGWWQKRGFF